MTIDIAGYFANRLNQRALEHENFPEKTGLIRLDLNEGPFPPPKEVVQAMCNAAKMAHRYPDHAAKMLSDKIAARLRMPTSHLVVACGTNEIIAITATLFLDRDAEVIVPRPTFVGHVKTSLLQGAKLIEVDVDHDGSINTDAMLAQVTPNTKLLYVTTPHNPTGHILEEDKFSRLVDNLPPHVMLYVDEAYFEFGIRAGAPDYLDIVKKRSHPWISTRTFSKAYGLAGARVGYGIASSEALAAAYRAARPNFTTNMIGMAGAIAALDAPKFVDASLSFIKKERERVGAALSRAGSRVLTTGANFTMGVLLPEEANRLGRHLAQNDIIVRVIAMPRGEAGLRVTIGSAEDNDKLLHALSQA